MSRSDRRSLKLRLALPPSMLNLRGRQRTTSAIIRRADRSTRARLEREARLQGAA